MSLSSHVIVAAGGNVGESQAARLGSHFSLMMLVTVPSLHLDDLKESLSGVPDMSAAIFEAHGAGGEKLTPQIACTYGSVSSRIEYARILYRLWRRRQYHNKLQFDRSRSVSHTGVMRNYLVFFLFFTDSGYFNLEGADNPGIVHKMTTALAKHGLSIDKMETDQEIAPYGGSMLFKMRGVATASAPLSSGFDISKIKRELKDLGDSVNCDVSLEDVADESFSASFYGG
jgi:glycine cleavage system regulatory protein